MYAGVKGDGVFLESVRQLSISFPWESDGASDNVMVHLLSIREGAEVLEERERANKLNSSIKSGQDLNICISTESVGKERALHLGETCLTCE